MLRVLTVDDEEDALDYLNILLEQTGRVTVLGRFRNALELFEFLESERSGGIDAIFMDIEMPGMSGLEAVRKLQAEMPRIRIVFTTAYSNYAVDAFAVRSVDYLLKPITLDRLNDSVDRIAETVFGQPARQAREAPPSIRCLGGFFLPIGTGSSRHLPWRTGKEKELCAFLAHHYGKPVDTSYILESLWPQADLERARSHLYACMSFLRKMLREHELPIRVENKEGGYRLVADELNIDARLLEEYLQLVISDGRLDERLYGRINELYAGDYLEGCDYGWAIPRRERLNWQYIQALRKFCKHFQSKRDTELAEDCLKRILAVSPDSEQDGRELIELYLHAGKRKEALDAYRQLHEAVRVQLGVEPEEATARLYDRICER